MAASVHRQLCTLPRGDNYRVAPGTNLHAVIAQGKHEGMPAWSADLTSDQIDALAGFILSPGGSQTVYGSRAASVTRRRNWWPVIR